MNDYKSYTKVELRQKTKDMLNYLTVEDILLKSKIIFEKIIDYKNLIDHDTFMVFLTIQKEFNTKELIDFLLKHNKRVLVPKIINENDMIAIDIMTLDKFSGIIDVIYVPGLVFGKDYNRLGRGKGYYDRFLKNNNIKIKIGVGFDMQIITNVPVEDHYQKLNIIITESYLYSNL